MVPLTTWNSPERDRAKVIPFHAVEVIRCPKNRALVIWRFWELIIHGRKRDFTQTRSISLIDWTEYTTSGRRLLSRTIKGFTSGREYSRVDRYTSFSDSIISMIIILPIYYCFYNAIIVRLNWCSSGCCQVGYLIERLNGESLNWVSTFWLNYIVSPNEWLNW